MIHWKTLQWRHNERDSVSNHQPDHCSLNRLFRRSWRKHQSSASLSFVRRIHRGPVNSPHKWPVTRRVFPFDDVIMTRLVIVPTLVIIIGTVCCRHNLRCHQWGQSWYHPNSRFSLECVKWYGIISWCGYQVSHSNLNEVTMISSTAVFMGPC